jgi:hypothetical protein
MKDFFTWYTPRYASRQAEYIQATCKKLLEEGWSLDHLRAPDKGGSSELTRGWKESGFKSRNP